MRGPGTPAFPARPGYLDGRPDGLRAPAVEIGEHLVHGVRHGRQEGRDRARWRRLRPGGQLGGQGRPGRVTVAPVQVDAVETGGTGRWYQRADEGDPVADVHGQVGEPPPRGGGGAPGGAGGGRPGWGGPAGTSVCASTASPPSRSTASRATVAGSGTPNAAAARTTAGSVREPSSRSRTRTRAGSANSRTTARRGSVPNCTVCASRHSRRSPGSKVSPLTATQCHRMAGGPAYCPQKKGAGPTSTPAALPANPRPGG